MKSNLKKLLPLTTIACGMMSFLGAAQDDMSSHRSPPPGHPAGQPGEYERGTYREITPNAGPRVTDGADVFITADFIWWTARQDGLGFAATGWSGYPSRQGYSGDATCCDDCSVKKGSIKRPGTEYDPGFKVGLGLNLGHDGWDVFAEFTWFHNHHKRTKVGDCCDTDTCRNIWPLWNIAGVFNVPVDKQNFVMWPDGWFETGPILKANGDWDIKFYNIDLELGRNFFLSQYLTMRPHIGFKGTWQDQSYDVTYVTEDPDNSPSKAFCLSMSNDIDHWGIGIRGGFDNAWYFMKNFCLYGDIALTALWSDFEVSRKDCIKTIDTCDGCNTCTGSSCKCPITKCCNMRIDNNFESHLRAVLEMAIGLRWETWFSDDDYHFSIEAGWEEQVWVNMNQMIRLRGETYGGDLTFHGLTIKARFDF